MTPGPNAHTRTLSNGVEMPLLGLGLWMVPEGPVAENAVRWALEAGYRHIDTAQNYGNEASVGRAIRASGIPREELFVTTKFIPDSRDAEVEAERSVERLGVGWMDLYLVHWPQGGATRAWKGMERALERGLTRAIGTSNFDIRDLAMVLAVAEVAPAVNQVLFNPFNFRRRLHAACQDQGVALEAYSPLNHGEDLEDPVVADAAERAGRTPAQVLLRWGIQRGIVVIPKSTRRERIVENSRVFDFSLGEAEMSRLDGLDRTDGTGRATEGKWWTLSGRSLNLAARLLRPIRG